MFGSFSPKPQLTCEQLAERLDGPEPPLVVDVREPAEYAEGHIPGSVLVPLGQLGQRLDTLPKDRALVMVCRSGARSGVAADALVKAGYSAVNMAGGMLAWRGPVAR